MQNLYYITSILVKKKKYYAPLLIFDDQYSLEKINKKKIFIYLNNLKFRSLSLLKIKKNIEKFIYITNFNDFNNKLLEKKQNKMFYNFLIYKASYCKIFSKRLKKITNLLNLQKFYFLNFSKINFNINFNFNSKINFYYKFFFIIQKNLIYKILINFNNNRVSINFNYYINFIKFVKSKFSSNYKFNSNFLYNKILKNKSIYNKEILD